MQKHTRPNIRMSVKHHDPENLTFSMFTTEDIRNLSVTKISTPLSFNVLGHPLKGGLYDPALGPLSDRSEPCGTCGSNIVRCPGHFGHIELPVPVVNPLFHKQLWTLIKLSCLSCFKLQISSPMKLLLVAKIKLLDEGYVAELEELTQEIQHIISSMNEEQGVEEFVKETIDAFMENLHNRQRFNHSVPLASEEDNNNTKNTNIQRLVYIDNTLKQYRAGNLCLYCQCAIPKVKSFRNKIMTTKSANSETDISTIQRGIVRRLNTVLIMPDQSQEYLRQLWVNEEDILRVIMPCLISTKAEHPTDIMFLKTIAVLPPLVRPVNYLQGQMIEHPQSQVYKSIIQDCLVLRNIIQTIQDGDTSQLPEEGRVVFEQIRGNSPVEKLHNAWEQLQTNVDHVMDRDMNKTTQSASCQGLKQVIEKKEGIIRMHMMGKRVNYAARSVITPDPNLNIDEIGIPEAFALKLTYPVPVTPWNVAELRKMILNGPNVHPGAVMVEGEDGSIKRLCATALVTREAIAKRLLTTSVKAGNFFRGTKIVHRHLQNGDVLLLNRQPTLHKPSIMAHKARILKGEKTLRLHYANCKAYNADFDGDEMNAHFPQNELARSEGYNIANVSNQYLVPKDGTPLSGLIQDHMVSGVRLTLRGKFFSREDYMQLVYSALTDVQGDLILLPPALIKPKLLWSGKQILSTVIINATPRGKAKINLTASAKIGPKAWEARKSRRWKCGREFDDPKTMSEAEVIIRNGELLCGVLDKIHYGATPYGLIHCVYELYGGAHSSKLLSAFGKLFQSHLQREGFTLGIEDILILPNADEKRTEFINACRMIGESTQKAALEVPEDTPIEEVKTKLQESYLRNPKFQAIVDRKYKSALDVFTNDINKTCLPAGLLKKFPDNNLQLMVQSGAKGSTVNTMQISCLLGQIELEGKRPPLMISGKSLPAFAPYDPTPRAGGFIDGRFMTGIQPQEFFFHCMAGREGLIDTAVKTSRSGYLQRCLIKHLEGLTVSYDSTVRDSDGSLIQLNYGEDGLDVPSSQFLKKEQLDFLVDNMNAILEPELLNSLRDLSTQRILKLGKKVQKWIKKHGSPLQKRRTGEFIEFCAENPQNDTPKLRKIIESCGRSKGALTLMKKWIKSDDEAKQKYKSKCSHCPDPVFSQYKQDSNFGVLTERIEGLIDDYLSSKRAGKGSSIDKDQLRDILSLKVMKNLSQPGEPVGLLAAQSIGEPSTQMTLNTFHFAGRGEMNVTLGIPRLREILMMASQNIKTPSMEIPFRTNLPKLEKRADKLRLKLTRCTLANVLTNANVEGSLELWPKRRMVYSLTMQFLRRKSYKREYCVQPTYVLTRTENAFFRDVFREIKKAARASGALLHVEEDKKPINDDQLDANDSEISGENQGRKGRLDLGETHESSDEDEPAEDADATTARSIARHQENQEYEDPEDASDESDNENEDDDEATESRDEEKQDKEDDEADDLDVANRKKKVIDMYPNVIDYEFDKKKYLSCKLKFWLPLRMAKLDLSRILRTVAEKVVLWETPLIRRAFTFQNASDETILKTDGLNIVEMFKYNEILELNRLYSNDIYGISQTYGIEAANRVIVKEVKDVFKMYGITVDPRHLLLIADYMTFDGTFQPLSRKGMENSASPLQQISFESSLTFMKNATVQSKKDDLTSPSSRLMLGQPCKSGTGLFTLMNRMDTDLMAH